MKVRFLLTSVFSILVYTTSFASKVDTKNCSLKECKDSLSTLTERINKLELNTLPEFLPVITSDNIPASFKYFGCSPHGDSDRSCVVWLHVVEKNCESIGARTPSIIEWAKLAQSFGAKGILTKEEYEKELIGPDKDKAIHVKYKNLKDGSLGQFFYSSAGYQAPNDEMSHGYILWSWSAAQESNDGNMYVFNGKSGRISKYGADGNSTIRMRCVRDK